MIYDCFTFYNELELLELRLNTLDKYVDYFVLSEATKTQNNDDKILYYEENKKLFEKFNHKIIHIVVDKFPDKLEQWTIENIQRNSIINGLKSCNDDDIIMISDLDEIPRPEFIKKYYNKNKITALDSDYFNFYMNMYLKDYPWTHGTKVLSYKNLKSILDDEIIDYAIDNNVNEGTTLTKVRLYYGPKQEHISHAGWHFSYIGDMKRKLIKFHSQCEGGKHINEEFIKNLIDSRKFHDHELVPVKLDSFFPKYLVRNKRKYAQFILSGKYKSLLVNLRKENFFKQIFSVENKNNHKVWTILGIKIKFRIAQTFASKESNSSK
ncbi:hypothetical protein J6O48_10635 [bacterium]|nr:hypothetical protein [bacterium]